MLKLLKKTKNLSEKPGKNQGKTRERPGKNQGEAREKPGKDQEKRHKYNCHKPLTGF